MYVASITYSMLWSEDGNRSIGYVMEENVSGRRRRSATMTDVLDVVSRSQNAFVVIRLPETTIAALNAPAVELFGKGAADLLGRRASSLFHGADAVYASIALSSLASGALDGYSARRRLATRQETEALTCVHLFQVDGAPLALGMTVPGEHPFPPNAVQQELAQVSDVEWVSRPRASGVHGSRVANATGESAAAVLDGLPRRQREIVAALLLGERTTDIAASLFVSASTVRSHLSTIFDAFGVRSQTQLLSLLRSKSSSSDETDPTQQ